MSFQGLISGSECAVGSNPLAQVLKHAEGDRSLQQFHALPGTPSAAASEHDVALARQFFEANAQGHAGPAFSMPHPDMARMGEMTGRPDLSEAWLMEQQNHMQAFEESKAHGGWAAEFGGPPQMTSPIPSMQQNMGGRPEYQQQPSFMTSPMYGSSMSMGMYGMNNPGMFYGMNGGIETMDQKGKGKSKEADFEAAFAQIAASLSPAQEQVSSSRIVEVEDGVTDLEDALKNTTLGEEPDAEYGTDFKKVWDTLQKSELPPPKEDLAKWEAEFSQLMNAQRDELEQHDYGASMQQAWESGIGDFSDSTIQPLKFDSEGLPILGDYVFEKNNKYMDHSRSRSLLDDAKLLLEQNGALSEAALMLEAAIQKGELGEGGYEAWILLGETRNMDEREEAGMRALLQGVAKAEQAGAAGAGMLSLAISFTNESFDRASHSMLLRWLRARFPSHPVPESTIQTMATNSSWDTHSRITELFLGLARTQHSQGVMDPDVQIGLGVLFYTNGEYDRAKDCFESALAARPKDYLLWNRLGSCLSNGSKPEEALGAYREALQLRPTYTRAIYNVGVACLNIGAHKEAAEHFLSAISLQETTNGDTSDQLWHTLRRALLSMERPDLADLAKPEAKNNLDVFRREGLDF
ncbi:hypothetical protein BDQ12DRAFT_593404 [Crucibulum laeve]|uniref:Uncharacterized protein n=1 Tax=Crucibulum laeve TaxID=68775 RepID=A0A5C3MSN4_9AGAR|nr:hypothetical protein BDQ12DRAFT_593404 [Crucibulum laeve]